MKKLIAVCIFIFSFVFLGLGLNFSDNAIASTNEKDTLNYVSLGDSISVGTYVTNAGNLAYENNYTNLLTSYVSTLYSDVSKVNYGKDGDNTTNFYSKITGLDESGSPLQCDALTLSQTIQNYIINADLVTISIGANDILGPAFANLMSFLVYDTDITPQLDAGLTSFINTFPNIVERLKELNPNAKYVFTNIYNPYLDLLGATEGVTLNTVIGTLPITQAKINLLGAISEVYINSSNSNVFPIKPMPVGADNKIIEKGINQYLAEYISGEENFAIVDTKTAFDNYYATNGDYDITNCSLLNYDGSLVSNFNVLLDPHPSEDGQALMYNVFKNYFDNNLIITNLDFNGAASTKPNDVKLYYKNDTITATDMPTLQKSGYAFSEWKIAPNYDETWNSEIPLTTHTTLKAFWTKVYQVIYNTNGGTSVDSEQVLEGQKAEAPVFPTKSESVFAGWYYGDESSATLWNFDNTINENITLFAKWAYSVCTSGDLIQKANNVQAVTFSTINADGMSLQWFVNGEPQENATENTFTFTAPEKANKQYEIYCMINNTSTNKHTLKIDYITPSKLEIKLVAKVNEDTYRFAIDSTENLDINKCVWYKSMGETTEEIGKGTTCEVKTDNNCNIFVVYNGETIVQSNTLSIENAVDNSYVAYIALGSFVLLASVLALIFAIKAKKS